MYFYVFYLSEGEDFQFPHTNVKKNFLLLHTNFFFFLQIWVNLTFKRSHHDVIRFNSHFVLFLCVSGLTKLTVTNSPAQHFRLCLPTTLIVSSLLGQKLCHFIFSGGLLQ